MNEKTKFEKLGELLHPAIQCQGTDGEVTRFAGIPEEPWPGAMKFGETVAVIHALLAQAQDRMRRPRSDRFDDRVPADQHVSVGLCDHYSVDAAILYRYVDHVDAWCRRVESAIDAADTSGPAARPTLTLTLGTEVDGVGLQRWQIRLEARYGFAEVTR